MNDWRRLVDEVLALQADPGMDTSPAPSLQWFPQQWLGDAAVQLMGMTARGCHHHLLMTAWKGFDVEDSAVPCSLPDDPELLGSLCQNPPDWPVIWAQVRRSWKAYHGRLWNVGLVKSYIRQMAKRRSAAASAAARWGKQNASAHQAESAGDANASGSDADASGSDANASAAQCSSASSSASSSATIEEEISMPTEAGIQAALIPGMEEPARRKTAKEERAENCAAVYAHYQRLQVVWYRALNKPPPRKTKMTTRMSKAIGDFLAAGSSVEDMREALDNVFNSAFHMGQGENYRSPRLTIEDIFKSNGKINSVAVLIGKTSPDKGMSMGVLKTRDRYLTHRAKNEGAP